MRHDPHLRVRPSPDPPPTVSDAESTSPPPCPPHVAAFPPSSIPAGVRRICPGQHPSRSGIA